VRFNTFPSKRALVAVATDPDRLVAVATDPDRLVAHSDHRDTAIADTYGLGVRPRVNQLLASVEATA